MVKPQGLDGTREDGPNFIHIAETGTIGGLQGVNEYGIGTVINALLTPDDGKYPYEKPYRHYFNVKIDKEFMVRKLTVPICICFTIITLISSASNAAANTITANCTMVAGPTKGTIQQFVIDLASGKMNLNRLS